MWPWKPHRVLPGLRSGQKDYTLLPSPGGDGVVRKRLLRARARIAGIQWGQAEVPLLGLGRVWVRFSHAGVRVWGRRLPRRYPPKGPLQGVLSLHCSSLG